jgi:hypothetical protein
MGGFGKTTYLPWSMFIYIHIPVPMGISAKHLQPGQGGVVQQNRGTLDRT